MALSVSIRHSLMIAEMISLGSTLREALIYSLQISKDTLESLLLSVQAETGETEVAKGEYVLYLPKEG
jgi:nitric oxide reductase NorQ protein